MLRRIIRPLKSAMQTYEAEGGRRDVVEAILSATEECEAGEDIGSILCREEMRWPGCDIIPVHVHEKISLKDQGERVDYRSLLAVCASCHHWIHTNPHMAKDIDLLWSVYGE